MATSAVLSESVSSDQAFCCRECCVAGVAVVVKSSGGPIMVILRRLPLDRGLYMAVLSTEVVVWHEKRARAFMLQVLLSSSNTQVANGSGDP